MNGLLSVRPRCADCDRNFLPESGYFLGAMMVAYVMTGVLTIPTLILLKIFGAELNLLLGLPLLQYVLMAPILLRYSRIIWIHAEYSTSRRLDRES